MPSARHREVPRLFGVRRKRLILGTTALALFPVAGVSLLAVAVNAQTEPVSAETAPTTPPSPKATQDAIEAPAEPPAEPEILSVKKSSGVSLSRSFSRRAPVDFADVPSVAYSAYSRAADVINAADDACALPWEILAGIGYVESDHGASRGARLNDDGSAKPEITSEPLDGRKGRAKVADTDGGMIDGDKKWDRSVGPMMLAPSTWTIIGVDADGDGKRDPQNIYDAALSTAVFLCHHGPKTASLVTTDDSTTDSTTGGAPEPGDQTGYNTKTLSSALGAYNAAPGYTQRVIEAAQDYLASFSEPEEAADEAPSAVPAAPAVPTEPVPTTPVPPTEPEDEPDTPKPTPTDPGRIEEIKPVKPKPTPKPDKPSPTPPGTPSDEPSTQPGTQTGTQPGATSGQARGPVDGKAVDGLLVTGTAVAEG